MIISENCKIFDDNRISQIFNEHFINIAVTLDLKSSITSKDTATI